MAFDVTISGRDAPLASRLLDALTKAGLLSQEATWEETPDGTIIIHVDTPWMLTNAGEAAMEDAQKRAFQCQRLQVSPPGAPRG